MVVAYLIAIIINAVASFFVMSGFFLVFTYESGLSAVDIIIRIYSQYDFWLGYAGYNLLCLLLFSFPLVFVLRRSKKTD